MKQQLFILAGLLLYCFNGVAAQQKPKSIARYQKEGIIVEAYDFKAFEPLLKMRNDTTYVINFWATWCVPCIKELPEFEKIHTQYKDKKVKVLLVSLDMKKQVESSLISFIIKRKLQSEVILLSDPDMNSWIGKVDPAWSGAIPATVIYNKAGRKFYEKSFTFEALEKEIKQITNL